MMKLCGMIMPGPVEKIFFRTCNARTPEILIANEEDNAVSGLPIAPVPIRAPANLTAILPGSGGCPGMTKLCRMIMTGPTRKIFFRTCNNRSPLGLYILERHVMTNPKLTQGMPFRPWNPLHFPARTASRQGRHILAEHRLRPGSNLSSTPFVYASPP